MKTELWICGIYQSSYETLALAIVALSQWEAMNREVIKRTGMATMDGLIVEFKEVA